MKKYNILLLGLFSLLSLTGCQKDEVLDKPVGFGENKEVIESSSVISGQEIEVNNDFAVDLSKQDIYATEPSSYIYEDEFKPIDYDDLSDNEIEEIKEIDSNSFIDPFTGEEIYISDILSVSGMQEEARDVWKPAYESGEVTRSDVESYINFIYKDIDKSERKKVIEEICSSDKEVEVIETEVYVEETFSDEELQKIVEQIRATGQSVNEGRIVDPNAVFEAGDSSGLPPMVAN